MTRLTITIPGSEGGFAIAADNIGQPTLCTITGTIKLVEFQLIPGNGAPTSDTAVILVQVSTSPVYQPPIGTTGIAPNEIASCILCAATYSVTTSNQAQWSYTLIGGNQLVLANFPISPGVPLFINAPPIIGANTPVITGQVVLFVE